MERKGRVELLQNMEGVFPCKNGPATQYMFLNGRF